MTETKTIALAKRIINHRNPKLGFKIEELGDNVGTFSEDYVTINKSLIKKLNYRTMKHVILHEVAHSLVKGHNSEFREVCKELGCLIDSRTLKLL